ncbi:MAG: tRNA 2-selenouridine(34) synthase MnmH [Parvularculaceae bacterium]
MIETVSDVDPAALERFDDIIDVRSPAEFAEDRLPGAINLPVLSNEERAEVGTIYVRQSRFLARRIGAAYIARNIACHLEEVLNDRPPGYHPLVYCWRGGQRSNAMATIFAGIGWRTSVLEGGYRTWRRSVVAALRESDAPLRVFLIDGQTGSAKTEILNRLGALGVQTLDLEGLAAHRGSVFGAHASRPQPSQKLFESSLWDALSRLDPDRPIVVEAESNHIGRVTVPRRLWRAMQAAPRADIRVDPEARAHYLLSAYADIIERPDTVLAAVDRLAPFQCKETIECWRDLAEQRDYLTLATALMRDHYDPLYNRSRKRRADRPATELSLGGLDKDEIARAARDIRTIMKKTFDKR